MADLKKWAEKQFAIVDQSGACTSCIKLITEDGQCWDTWEPPWPTPAEWAEVASTLLGELMLQWPARPIRVTFVAVDKDGQIRSQLPMHVQGKQKGGSMSLGGESQALAASMDAQAATMQRILTTAGSHVEALGKTVSAQNEALADAYGYIKAMRERDALNEGDPTTQQLKEQLTNHLPRILDIADKLASGFGLGTKPKMKGAATNGAATNGAGSEQ
jgi:hypothetical protein